MTAVVKCPACGIKTGAGRALCPRCASPRAAALFPDDFATHHNLGRAFHEWGDHRAAVESYLDAIALAPGEAALYLSLARSYEALARPADAVAAYARYLEKAPESCRTDEIRTRIEALRHPAETGSGQPATPSDLEC